MVRRAAGLLEVLIALLIITMAALPLLQSGASLHHITFFTESQALASIRARTLLSLTASLDFAVLHHVLGSRPTSDLREVPLESLYQASTVDFLLAATGEGTASYRRAMSQMQHRVRGRVIDADRILLEVQVTTQVPAEGRREPHRCRLGLLLHRPEATHGHAVSW